MNNNESYGRPITPEQLTSPDGFTTGDMVSVVAPREIYNLIREQYLDASGPLIAELSKVDAPAAMKMSGDYVNSIGTITESSLFSIVNVFPTEDTRGDQPVTHWFANVRLSVPDPADDDSVASAQILRGFHAQVPVSVLQKIPTN